MPSLKLQMHPYKVTKDLFPERGEGGGKKKQTKKQEHLSDPFPNTFFVQNNLLWNHHQMTFCHPAEADAQPVSKPPSPKMVLSLTSE